MSEERRGRGRPAGPTGRQLLEVARSVFLERGYAGATIDQVAARARVSKASVYREHPSKAALYAAVVSDWSASGRHAMRPALERLLHGDDLDRDFFDLAHTIRSGVLSPDVLAMRRLVTSEADAQPEVAACYLQESWARNIEDLADAFRLLNDGERLQIDDVHAAADEFVWLVVGPPLNAALLTGTAPAVTTNTASAVKVFLARYRASAQ